MTYVSKAVEEDERWMYPSARSMGEPVNVEVVLRVVYWGRVRILYAFFGWVAALAGKVVDIEVGADAGEDVVIVLWREIASLGCDGGVFLIWIKIGRRSVCFAGETRRSLANIDCCAIDVLYCHNVSLHERRETMVFLANASCIPQVHV